jgi:hypothetical protein
MSDNLRPQLSSKIDAGVKTAIAEAIERHRKLGQSISIMRDGQIITLTGEQIPPRSASVAHQNSGS